jgi:hypothetical protein
MLAPKIQGKLFGRYRTFRPSESPFSSKMVCAETKRYQKIYARQIRAAILRGSPLSHFIIYCDYKAWYIACKTFSASERSLPYVIPNNWKQSSGLCLDEF